ncbi:PDZ domain-containing protein [Allocatelliglobosispora scoriae]|uniref:endopeptidase La n=1 Tax=Allocatelliglobosispora scoriae TaxID=643052 RepID=A0A841BX38_9ACTN|nr:PDZ domain-containing protein [Allocatelliglobosispora scoriae]MBB5871709.1 PDZ domain-containing protein [Allocatelliglobosispora scoriae]
MKSRGLTVLLGAILAGLLMWQVTQADVPYVVLGAGPTYDTLGKDDKGAPVIEVTGKDTSTSAGQLRMVTVGVQSETDIFSVIKAWWSGEQAVVPRELIYPPGQTQEQVEETNKQDFAASQSSAETVALKELGYPIRATVKEVAADGAAVGKLAVGDIVTTVDGTPVDSTEKLVELIRAKPVGATLKIGRERDGKAEIVEITTKAGEDGTPRVGVSAENKQPHPFELKIHLDDVGGPSAGLMFALGIIDKLTPADLTGGKIIAGTGTIDDNGTVGPIGGIAQKLVGAKDADAAYFLTPAANCDEAKANAVDGLTLVKVGTLDEGLDALTAIREGKPLPKC